MTSLRKPLGRPTAEAKKMAGQSGPEEIIQDGTEPNNETKVDMDSNESDSSLELGLETKIKMKEKIADHTPGENINKTTRTWRCRLFIQWKQNLAMMTQ